MTTKSFRLYNFQLTNPTIGDVRRKIREKSSTEEAQYHFTVDKNFISSLDRNSIQIESAELFLDEVLHLPSDDLADTWIYTRNGILQGEKPSGSVCPHSIEYVKLTKEEVEQEYRTKIENKVVKTVATVSLKYQTKPEIYIAISSWEREGKRVYAVLGTLKIIPNDEKVDDKVLSLNIVDLDPNPDPVICDPPFPSLIYEGIKKYRNAFHEGKQQTGDFIVFEEICDAFSAIFTE